MSETKATLEGYEQDCGVLRVQALAYGDAMMDRVDAALGVALRHCDRIHRGQLSLVPAVVREIEDSIRRARTLLTNTE